MRRIGWDISHQEFTIEDYYYFSVLKEAIIRHGGIVKEVAELNAIKNFDVLVINYPEKSFTRTEVDIIEKFMLQGGRVIVLGYYQNEDNVADFINSLTTRFGLEINHDTIIDEENNSGDKYFIVTQRILRYNNNVGKVLMPCTASIKPSKNAHTIIIGEKTARTTSNNKPIIAAETKIGKGELILIGTCVFWDNFSIKKYDNLKFALNILF